MSEHEMREKIEQLQRELMMARADRDRLHSLVCKPMPVDPPEVMEEQIREIMNGPLCGIDDIIEELMRDDQDSSSTTKQIPA